MPADKNADKSGMKLEATVQVSGPVDSQNTTK